MILDGSQLKIEIVVFDLLSVRFKAIISNSGMNLLKLPYYLFPHLFKLLPNIFVMLITIFDQKFLRYLFMRHPYPHLLHALFSFTFSHLKHLYELLTDLKSLYDFLF